MDNLEELIVYTKNLTLLYVEDNKEARESTISILEEFFPTIIIGVNGEDGLNKFKENEIDLIITDINMPKMNGLEMIDEVNAIDKNIPILVLSAYNESGYFMESIKVGVDGYLLKPIEIEQFLGVLEKVVEKIKLKKDALKNKNFLTQYKEITDKSAIISIINKDNVITYVNEAFCRVSEYSKDELLGIDYHSILKYRQAQELHNEIWRTIQNDKQIWQGVLKFVSRFGSTYYLKTTIKPILDENNEIIEFIALRDDVTDVMNHKKQLDDALKNSKKPILLYLKLEDFDTVESFYDNVTVEMIQDEVGEYINLNIPEELGFDGVYQLGNGEYALLNEKDICFLDENYFISEVKKFQQKLKEDMVCVGDIDYDMAVMVSLSHGDEQILENAKLGIKKLTSSNQDFIISNDLVQKEYEKAQQNIQTLSLVKNAIANGNIISYFQPIIDNNTKEIAKYESLVRLVDDGKVLSPFFFLEVAKKGKYYAQITNMVLDNSFLALTHTSVDISINLSALDIEQKSTRDKIFELLEQNKQSASRIVFELLEDENVKDFNTIKEFICQVKKLGVKIAIDDFGAGYSNFERLLDYQPDILKIDGSLIKNITTDSFSYNVVETIIEFARKQNISTIAEFVENEEIFNILKELGVDYSQGYFFGKPEPLKNI
jgi:PAS domain S-box-containing protein